MPQRGTAVVEREEDLKGTPLLPASGTRPSPARPFSQHTPLGQPALHRHALLCSEPPGSLFCLPGTLDHLVGKMFLFVMDRWWRPRVPVTGPTAAGAFLFRIFFFWRLVGFVCRYPPCTPCLLAKHVVQGGLEKEKKRKENGKKGTGQEARRPGRRLGRFEISFSMTPLVDTSTLSTPSLYPSLAVGFSQRALFRSWSAFLLALPSRVFFFPMLLAVCGAGRTLVCSPPLLWTACACELNAAGEFFACCARSARFFPRTRPSSFFVFLHGARTAPR